MGGPGGHYAEWNKPDTEDKSCMIHFHEVPRVVKFIETDRRMGVPGTGGDGNVELLFNGDRISVWENEKFWRRMCWWLHNNVNVLETYELYA